MRRLSAVFVLCAWLLASGAHWDFVQGAAWARMIAQYSRTMPLGEAIRLTFTADNLCGVCEFVADGKTRPEADTPAADGAPRDPASPAKTFWALAPEPMIVCASVSEPAWPTAAFAPISRSRPAPPTEPPRAA